MHVVESEFARNSRQALIDFNKLVLGSAHNKLFIGPQVSEVEPFVNVLKPAARACTGNVYIALIPHPAKWKGAKWPMLLILIVSEQTKALTTRRAFTNLQMHLIDQNGQHRLLRDVPAMPWNVDCTRWQYQL